MRPWSSTSRSPRTPFSSPILFGTDGLSSLPVLKTFSGALPPQVEAHSLPIITQEQPSHGSYSKTNR